MEVLLAVSAFGLLYPYVLYPLLLAAVGRGFERTPAPAPSHPPSVAILVSAFNEENRIGEKIANFNALDYPKDQLELWIGTDGSTDGTAQVVQELADQRIHLVERPARSGKTAVLNDLASRAQTDLLVFTDVNALFRPDALQKLAAAAADPTVGLVSGRTVIRAGNGQVQVEGAYYRLESWLKAREGACGWVAGADGAIYALRANLYQYLPPEWINDLVHPCQVVASGFKARLEPLAISEEAAGDDAGRELDRQTRITAQASYLLAMQSGPLLRNGCWGMLWVLASHKWLRWIAGLWILLGLLALVVLSPLLAFAAVGMLLLFVLGWRAGAGWAGIPIYFLLIHFAYLRGLFQALAGERYVTWKPRAG
jgi:glycosyltransferase involved in cell wall biosynthesis